MEYASLNCYANCWNVACFEVNPKSVTLLIEMQTLENLSLFLFFFYDKKARNFSLSLFFPVVPFFASFPAIGNRLHLPPVANRHCANKTVRVKFEDDSKFDGQTE